MHVMVATDGSLDPKKTARIVGNLAGSDGRITVLSVVEVPRTMLDDMRKAAADAAGVVGNEDDVEYRRSRAADAPPIGWVGDDAVVTRYVTDQVASRTASLATELDAANVEYTIVGVEGESAARSVIEAVSTHEVDVLCIGTHGIGRFEGLLGSLSTKVARLAPCSVVLIR